MDVLNLLASEDRSLRAAEIGQRLGITRTTCSAVLLTLADYGYVERSRDGTYALGPGLLRVSNALRERLPLSPETVGEIRQLNQELGFGCSLTRASADDLTIIQLVGTKYQFPPGIQAGQRYMLRPLHGAAVVAWRSQAEIERWISQALEGEDTHRLRCVLAGIRELGYGVWRLEPTSASILGEIGDIVNRLRRSPNSVELRWKLWQLLGLFAGHGYTPDELNSQSHFSVAYIIAPVFDSNGEVRYTLDLHVLLAEMTAEEIRGCARRLLASAAHLAQRLEGLP